MDIQMINVWICRDDNGTPGVFAKSDRPIKESGVWIGDRGSCLMLPEDRDSNNFLHGLGVRKGQCVRGAVSVFK